MTEGATLDPIAFWARVRPDRVALRQKDEVWTYRRLEEAVSRIAYAFYDEGTVSGEHVSIEFESAHSLHFAITLHALHRIGLLPVLIDPRLAEAQRIELRNRAAVDFALTTSPERVEVFHTDRPMRRVSVFISFGSKPSPSGKAFIRGNCLTANNWPSRPSARATAGRSTGSRCCSALP